MAADAEQMIEIGRESMPKMIRIIRKLLLKMLPDSNRLRYAAYRPKLETWRKCYSGTYPVF